MAAAFCSSKITARFARRRRCARGSARPSSTSSGTCSGPASAWSGRGEVPPRVSMTMVVVVGGGFAGITAAKVLGGVSGIEVTLVDKRNHHLFHSLLYQVATAGLSPAEIAAPIRSMLSRYTNIRVVLGTVQGVDAGRRVAATDIGELAFDYLILGCGATHSYFGHDQWEEY